jgi:hypothetical protein
MFFPGIITGFDSADVPAYTTFRLEANVFSPDLDGSDILFVDIVGDDTHDMPVFLWNGKQRNIQELAAGFFVGSGRVYWDAAINLAWDTRTTT